MISSNKSTNIVGIYNSSGTSATDDFNIYNNTFHKKIYTTSTVPEYNNIVCNDVIIDKQSLKEKIEEIYNMLFLINRDVIMEEKYPELKEAYDNYNTVLSRLRAMEALVGENNIE